MFKQIILTIIAASALSCSTLTSYTALKDPEVEVSAVDVTSVSTKDIGLDLKLSISNPNGVAINLDKVTYALKFSGKDVTSGMIDQGIKIAANGQGDVVVPLKFQYNMIDSLITGFMKKTLAKDYELSGTAQLGILSIPFSKKGEVNITQ